MKTYIREIEEKDFNQLILLFKEFADFEKSGNKMTNTLERMKIEKDNINGYVVLDSQENILAYTTYFYTYYTWTGKSIYLDDLYVKSDYRSNGIGTELINKVIEKAKSENCTRIRWQVSKWNNPAIDFYKKLGATINEVEMNCDIEI